MQQKFGRTSSVDENMIENSIENGIDLPVWYKTKFGSQNLATKFGNHLCMATKILRQF